METTLEVTQTEGAALAPVVQGTMMPVDALVVHEDAMDLHQWPDNSEEFAALCDSMAARGQDYAILVTEEGLILDGRHRWRAAKKLGWTEIRAEIRDEIDACTIIIESLLQRRHYTKGSRAYQAYPLLSYVFEEAKDRQLAALQKGKASVVYSVDNGPVHYGETVEAVAERFGFSRPLFYQARDIHKEFDASEEFRKEWEPKILAGECGLGAALAGIASQKETARKGGARHAVGGQLELFTKGFETWVKRAGYFRKAEDKAVYSKTMVAAFEVLNDEDFAAMEELVREEQRAIDKARSNRAEAAKA